MPNWREMAMLDFFAIEWKVCTYIYYCDFEETTKVNKELLQ